MVCGLNRWNSPFRFHWYTPPTGRRFTGTSLPAEGKLVLGQCFLGNFIEAHAFNTGSSAGEIFINHIFIETNDLEYLRTLVGLQGGDTHFREHFQQAIIDGLDVILLAGTLHRVWFRSLPVSFISRMEDKAR